MQKEMVGKIDGLDLEQCTDEAATSVFREVLGHRPGYVRGLGEMVIPESTRQWDFQREKEYLALIEKHKQDTDNYNKDAKNYKKDADKYKTQLDAIQDEMQLLYERQNESDKMMKTFFQNFPSYMESLQSHGETPWASTINHDKDFFEYFGHFLVVGDGGWPIYEGNIYIYIYIKRKVVYFCIVGGIGQLRDFLWWIIANAGDEDSMEVM